MRGTAALREQAREAWAKRDLWKAKACIEQALGEQPTGEELAHTYVAAGIVYREIGDTYLAMELFESVRSQWEEFPNLRPLFEGLVLYNLGLVYRQRRDLARSQELLRTAAEEFRREGMRQYRTQALHYLSWLQCEMDQPEEAAATLQIVDDEGLLPDDTEAQRRHSLVAAYCALVAGRPVEALERADDLTRVDDPADVLAYAYWLSGHAAVALGDLAGAEQMAAQASTAALRAVDSRCMSDVSRLRSRIAEARQQGA